MLFTITNNVEITNGEVGCVWKSFILSFLASLPFLTHGIETTALASSAHSGHFVAGDDQLWPATAMILGAAVSAPIYSCFIDRFGRKYGIYVISLMQGASCIPLFLPPNDISTIILNTIAGLVSGGLFTVLPTYIREISTNCNRGLVLAFMMLMTSAGYLVKLVMGDEEIMFLMVALVAVQFLSMLVVLESPSYFVMVGKIDAATRNISILRRLSLDNPILSRELATLQDESERAKANGRLTLWNILKHNLIYRDATKIGFVLNTSMVLCGSIIFLDQDKTLAQLKLDSDPDKTLVVGCLCAGSFFCFLLVRFVERRYLLATGFVGMTLSMGVLAVYTQADLTISTFRWVPVLSHGILVLSYGFVWALPTIIMVEIYNFEIRATMLGVLYIYCQLIKLAHVHSFQYIEDYVGIYTLLYIFACTNLMGVVYSLFFVPDLKNKSVRQIEKQLKRIPLLKL